MLLLLLFPFGVQFVHAIEGHDQTHCTETKTHIHESKVHCDLCDFHFQVVDITFNTFDITGYSKLTSTFSSFISTPFYYNHLNHYFLRGPPSSIKLSV